MNQGDYHDPYRASIWASGPGEDHKPGVGTVVAVGVAATAAIATAMYFLGGREATGIGNFAKSQIGIGAIQFNDGYADHALFKSEREAATFAANLGEPYYLVRSDDPMFQRALRTAANQGHTDRATLMSNHPYMVVWSNSVVDLINQNRLDEALRPAD